MSEARLPNHFPWQLPRQVVDDLAGIGVVRSFPRNTVIIHEGEPGDSMYIVLSGRVRVFLADHDGKEEDGRLMLPHKLTQLDIAKRVGASREMVSRILADLKRGGYIEQDGHRIIILRSPPQAW
jgi:CRP-like cAMP-binding protein